jgi:hypothetical protein
VQPFRKRVRRNYFVNLHSLSENFPSEFGVPKLLVEFGGWLKERGDGRVGWLSLQSERFNDFWIENGADYRRSI